jgi:hypothetical protein
MRLKNVAGIEVRTVEDSGEVDPALLAWIGTNIVRWDRCGLVVRTVDREVLVRDGWVLARWPSGELVVFGPAVVPLLLETEKA